MQTELLRLNLVGNATKDCSGNSLFSSEKSQTRMPMGEHFYIIFQVLKSIMGGK